MANMNHWMYGGASALIFWGGVILLAGLVLRSVLGRNRERPPEPEPPLDILKRRYARGEIDKEEFEKRRRDVEDAG